MHQKTSPPTDRGQRDTGGGAGVRLTLAVVADLVAVVTVAVSVLDGKPWSSVAIVAGPVAVLASLLYLLDPRTKGRLAKPLVTVLLVVGLGLTGWGVLTAVGNGGEDPRPDNGSTSTSPTTTTVHDTTTSTPSASATSTTTGTTTSTATSEPTTVDPTTVAPGPQFREVFSHSFTLFVSDSYDLDRRQAAAPSAGADFGLDSSSVYAPATGGLTLSEGTDGDPAGCPLDIPYINRLPVAEIPDGQPICVVTDEDQLAVVTVAGAAGEINVTYRLWRVV